MSNRRLIPTIVALLILISVPMGASAKAVKSGYTQKGIASYYGGKFHGRKTASGEIFNQWARSTAHKSLPLGTRVRVTKLSDGRSIVVRINDRGPFIKGRIIDLSRKAAQDLGSSRAVWRRCRSKCSAFPSASGVEGPSKNQPIDFKPVDRVEGRDPANQAGPTRQVSFLDPACSRLWLTALF